MNPTPSDFIGVYDDALSGEFCQEIIDTFESFPQIQSAGKIGSGIDATKKDSLDSCISEYQEWTPINQRLLDITLQKLVGNSKINSHVGVFNRKHVSPTFTEG